jgi:CBS domain-containing protein
MKVKDVMTERVQCCTPETNLAAAAELMWNNDCGILPVVEDGKLAGVITDRDICMALGTRNYPARDVIVRDVQTANVESCQAESDLQRAMEAMRRAKVRRLPVINESGVVQGILSLNDIELRVDRSHAADLSYEQVISTLKAIDEHRYHAGAAPAEGKNALAAAS